MAVVRRTSRLLACVCIWQVVHEEVCCSKLVTVQDLQYGDSPQAKKHILERWRIRSLLAASLVATWVVFFLLEGIFSGYVSTAHSR